MGYSSSEIWSTHEIKQLKDMAAAGLSLKEVKQALHGRSDWAIIIKLRSIILKQNYDDLTWINFYSDSKDMAYPIKELRPNHDEVWSVTEREQLAKYFEGDTELGQISKLLGKTDSAVFIQLKKIYNTTDGLEPLFSNLCTRIRMVKVPHQEEKTVSKTELTTNERALVPDVCRKFAKDAEFMLCKMKPNGTQVYIMQTGWPQCVFQVIPFESRNELDKFDKKNDDRFKLFNSKQVHNDYWKVGLLFVDCLLKVDDSFPNNLLKKITNNAAYDAAEWYIAYSKLSK